MLNRYLFVSVSMLALAPVAIAQTPETPAPEQAAPAPAAQTPAAAPPAGPERIVVTATLREQDILDVPTSVANISAEQIELSGVSDVKQLTAIAPGLDVTNTLGESYGAVIRVRGVGTSGSNPGLESATGVYVDGVYRSRSNLAINDLPGVERIELLRGPQGTLFGKNTTAGVLNIVTQRPSSTFGGRASVTAGNFGLARFDGTVEGGILENLAGRLDMLTMTRDGYHSDPLTGREFGERERLQLRGQLEWTVSDDIDVRFIADYTDKDEDHSNYLIYREITPAAAGRMDDFGPVPTAQNELKDYNISPNDGRTYFDRVKDAGLSGEVTWDVGPGRLTSVTAWRKFEADRNFDPDAGPVDILFDPRDGEVFEQLSQEVRYQGLLGKLDYLFGFFYAKEDIESRDSYTFGADYEQWLNTLAGSPNIFATVTGLTPGTVYPEGGGAYDVYNQTGESFAFFTHNTYAITDALSLTAGLRYTIDEKTLDATLTSDNPGCEAALAAGGVGLTTIPAALRGLVCVPNFDTRRDGVYGDSRSEEEFSGTVSALYKLTDDLSAYATYSRGYKSGGYQFDRGGLIVPGSSADQLAFIPEFADAYELGMKGVFFDGFLRANAALFRTEVQDYQFSFSRTLPSGESQRVVANLPELVSQGVEVETFLYPLEELTLSLASTFQESQFGDSNFPTSLAYLQGSRNFNSPKWMVTSSATWNRDLEAVGLRAFAYVDARWQSDANVSYTATLAPSHMQEAYATANARIGLGDIDDVWTVELWARNLTDENVWAGTGAGTLQPGTTMAYGNEPRTYGATLRVKW
jgi:iron complex outermembrane receptor protein